MIEINDKLGYYPKGQTYESDRKKQQAAISH